MTFAEDPDPAALRALRARLALEVASRDPEISASVIDTLRAVPRHLFVPDVGLSTAYENRALGIGHGQTISQPTVVAIMTDALHLIGEEKVLEIGTGSGYQTAVLARLAGAVYSIESIPELAESARELLAHLGHGQVQLRCGDGAEGWPEEAPFDGILVTAAPAVLPPSLFAQLADGGTLVAPIGTQRQRLLRWSKRGDHIARHDLGAVRFVPLVSDPTDDD